MGSRQTAHLLWPKIQATNWFFHLPEKGFSNHHHSFLPSWCCGLRARISESLHFVLSRLLSPLALACCYPHLCLFLRSSTTECLQPCKAQTRPWFIKTLGFKSLKVLKHLPPIERLLISFVHLPCLKIEQMNYKASTLHMLHMYAVLLTSVTFLFPVNSTDAFFPI